MSEYETGGEPLRVGMSLDYNRGTVTVIDYPGAKPRAYGPDTPEAQGIRQLLGPLGVERYVMNVDGFWPDEPTITHVDHEARSMTFTPKRQGTE